MSKRQPKHAPQRHGQVPATRAERPTAAKHDHSGLRSHLGRVSNICMALLLFAFCAWTYADVFLRCAESGYVSANAMQMKWLTDQQWGLLYWGARWLLLVWQNLWTGAIFTTAVLSATAWLLQRTMRPPHCPQGVCPLAPLAWVLPLGELAWIVWRGTNLYHKGEPSLVVLVPVAGLALALIIYIVASALRLLRRKAMRAGHATAPTHASCIMLHASCIVMPLLTAAGMWATAYYCQNEILTARLLRYVGQERWDEIAEQAVEARRPTRTIAVCYAIALTQQGQLVERLFDFPFDYPQPRLDKRDGNEEYTLFLAEANFYAGLTYPAYRCAMEYVVMNGPRLYQLKRLALCAVMNQERALARKYMRIISQMPLQQDFVRRYSPMIDHPELIDQDATLARVKELRPVERHIEQNYRTPAFLGYNCGLLEGSNATLQTSIAACLYSKNLDLAMPRINMLAQKTGGLLPASVQQAIAILARKNQEVAARFPDIAQRNLPALVSFLTEASPTIQQQKRDREAFERTLPTDSAARTEAQDNFRRAQKNVLREELRGWLGTYYYYYFCENNDPSQVEKKQGAGVN